MKREFITRDEEEIAVDPYFVNWQRILPVEKIPIARSVFDTITNIGKVIEERVHFPFEFYGEGFTVNNDPTIHFVHVPKQELVSAIRFAPTHNMIREIIDKKAELSTIVEGNWNNTASIHGHGRANVGFPLQFSALDQIHMQQFLATESLHTTIVLDDLAEVGVSSRHGVITQQDENIIIQTPYAYHPDLIINGLPVEEQDKLIKKLEIKTGSTNLQTIVAAYLQEVAQHHKHPIQAFEAMLRTHSYFIVVDNEGRHYAKVGIQVRNTLTGKEKQVFAEREIKIDDDTYDLPHEDLPSLVDRAYENVHKLLIPSVKTSSPVKATSHALNLGKPIEKEKGTRELNTNDIASLFVHSAIKYLQVAHTSKSRYGQFISNFLTAYANGTPTIEDTYRLNCTDQQPTQDTHKVVYYDFTPHAKTLAERIASQVTEQDDQLTFISQFAFAPNIPYQDELIQKFSGVFHSD